MKRVKKSGLYASICILVATATIMLLPAAVRAQSDCDLDNTLRMFEGAYAPVQDYTCLLSKKEWVDGKYVVWNNVIYKFRKPDCYYMKWTEGENFGREIIYAGKKYGYQLEVHLGGMLNVANFSLDPKGFIALRSSRHPIMESDFGFILRMIQQNVRKAQKEKSAVIDCLGEAEIGGRKVRKYRAEFPKGRGFINHIIHLSVDDETDLPMRIEMYDWDEKLVESYTFTNLKINTGLKDSDFDTENDSYGY